VGFCEAMTQTILFICTGNYYRSRFAEAVFNHHAKQDNIPWRAFSRGLAAELVMGDISQHTAKALIEMKIDRSCTGAWCTSLTRHDLEVATRVVALRRAEHHPMMLLQFRDWADRIEYLDVSDIDEVSPVEALPQIERWVLACLKTLTQKAENE